MTDPNPPKRPTIRPYGSAAIAEAAALIRAGEPVAIATETVYGLAADATRGESVAAIYAAKGRPSFNPLIVHVLDLAAAEQIAEFDPLAQKLAATFWPGPLTLVLPLRSDSGIASLVTAGLATIAIRVPAHTAMRALLEATGVPLAAPSANASGNISPTRAAHVAQSLADRIPLVIDAGPTVLGLESTIVAVTDDMLRLLRPGPITTEMLRNATGLTPLTFSSNNIEAPGQLASHYAPSLPIRLNAETATPEEWHIGFGPISGDRSLSPEGNPITAAANLFEALHQADASGCTAIAVAPIPHDGLGAAINDRLARAAAPR
ncbi:threonylcarbamoyl-AMP synthase [Sphingomonas prati]|uniref:Threonylcarbamoyl-AMP synthase n=1 Tax=Sphingomonas prati TaxID=1843237 RepID=A0A7W9F376_9SPHN|nr:L-threonylcarbamoyladenylate synthase [Sphingomonas prati]MBB5729559.1 L-threonylcarbamoyladenylate synthase [Sphingomonas prati]GGE76542.1 threonylcarbamoyl-AMP synthase [Sphingomonas prati]